MTFVFYKSLMCFVMLNGLMWCNSQVGASRAWARRHSHRDNRRRAEISIQVRFKTAQHVLQESSVLCCCRLVIMLNAVLWIHTALKRRMLPTTPQYITSHHITSHHITSHHITEQSSALHYAVLHCAALHCTTLYYAALHCTILHYTALHCTTLH